MDWETTSAHKYRIRLGFKQCGIILTKEQSVLTKIMISFIAENTQTQYVLGYKIHLYFHDYDYMLTIEIDKNGHSYRNIYYKIKILNTEEQELGYKFIRIDLDEDDVSIFKTINKIFRYVKQSAKKNSNK